MEQVLEAKTYWESPARVGKYLQYAASFPHRLEGDKVLVDHIPERKIRILDLGTGDGHLFTKIREHRPDCTCLGLDFSEPMLQAGRSRFRDETNVAFRRHDLNDPLPNLGKFDAIVTCLAIHNVSTARQLTLYEEVFNYLVPGGVFCNLDHIGSPTGRMHKNFYRVLGKTAECFNDFEAQPLDLATHLRWLRELEFDDVDCYWKWLEMALMVGVKPGGEEVAQ